MIILFDQALHWKPFEKSLGIIGKIWLEDVLQAVKITHLKLSFGVGFTTCRTYVKVATLSAYHIFRLVNSDKPKA